MDDLKESLKRTLKKYWLFYKIREVYIFLKVKFRKYMLTGQKKTDIIINMENAMSVKTLSAIRPEAKLCEKIKFTKKEIDLTVILPIYNAELYLEKCLMSLKNQNTQYSYEIICIDDGSTDSSIDILKKYASDKKFRIIHQANEGHSGARNTGLKQPLGKYVMFVDSDDYITENYIEDMLKDAYKSDADIVISGYTKVNNKSDKLCEYRYAKGNYSSFVDYIQFDGTPWGKIYRRELWINVFFPRNMMFEDTIIMNVIFRKCKSVFVCSNDNAIYFYRIYGNNTIDKLQGSNKLLDALWAIKFSLDLCKCGEQILSKNNEYYYYLLIQCSTHLYYRICNFTQDIQYAIFNVVCNLVNEYVDLYGQLECKDNVLLNLQIAFTSHDFTLWKQCSKIYPNNGLKKIYFNF